MKKRNISNNNNKQKIKKKSCEKLQTKHSLLERPNCLLNNTLPKITFNLLHKDENPVAVTSSLKISKKVNFNLLYPISAEACSCDIKKTHNIDKSLVIDL